MSETTVLYVQPHMAAPGGSTRVVLDGGRALRRRGFRPVVLSVAADERIIGPYREDLEFEFLGGSLPDTFRHWLDTPRLLRACRQAVERLQPDLLFPQVFPSSEWGFYLKRKFPALPCVWYCHDTGGFLHSKDYVQGLDAPMRWVASVASPVVSALDRRLAQRPESILTNSRYTADWVRRTYGREALVAYPGVDTDRFRPGGPKERAIFAVSRWSRFKRLDVLLEAIHLLHQEGRFEGWTFRIGGGGEDLPKAQEWVQARGLQEHVRFLGPLPEADLVREYQRAALLLHGTVGEPFGLVPVEALACGTPVLGSSVGGTAETVTPGVTGAHFGAASARAIADALAPLLQDPDGLARMGRAARERVLRDFTWDRYADVCRQEFDRLCGAPPAVAPAARRARG